MLRLLAPLASTLSVLDLNNNKLGGVMTPDIAAFTKMELLTIEEIGLTGALFGHHDFAHAPANLRSEPYTQDRRFLRRCGFSHRSRHHYES